jgi:hypothetical protein
MSEKSKVYWCKDCVDWSGLVGSYNANLEKYTCSVCGCPLDVFVAVESSELAELEAWKFAIEEACIVDFVEITTPEETFSNLINWNVKMALDPAISKEANELIALYKTVVEEEQDD